MNQKNIFFALYLTLLLLLKCRHNKWASSEESRDANFRFAAGPALKRRELSELLLLGYRRRSSLNSLLFSAGQVTDRKIKTFPILKFRNVRNNEKKLHLKFKESSDLIVNASSLFCFASQATQAKNPLIKIKSLALLVP